MTKAQKQQFWQQHLQAWQASTLSQAAYCRKADVPLASFGYWRKRLLEASATTPMIIPVVREPVMSGVQLRSPSGWQVVLPASVGIEVLRHLLAVLP